MSRIDRIVRITILVLGSLGLVGALLMAYMLDKHMGSVERGIVRDVECHSPE